MVTFQFDWAFTWEVFLVCMKQVPVCFFSATAAMLTGLVLGIPMAAARNKKKWFRYLANAYVHLIRGIPTILLFVQDAGQKKRKPCGADHVFDVVKDAGLRQLAD